MVKIWFSGVWFGSLSAAAKPDTATRATSATIAANTYFIDFLLQYMLILSAST
jgi:hypothetical protein